MNEPALTATIPFCANSGGVTFLARKLSYGSFGSSATTTRLASGYFLWISATTSPMMIWSIAASRKPQGRFCAPIPGAPEPGEIAGISARLVAGNAVRTTVVVTGPSIANTFLSARSRVTITDCSGLDLLSSITNSIGAPSMPPALLISSAAICAEISACCP